jgi:hypothetical protein
MAINDATSIEPSYKVGDDGIPTGFKGNKSDIECTYESFAMTVEVTLLSGRDQWTAEGQPVMRHLRDFEDGLEDGLDVYCIFVAPYIHRDTLNTFWGSIKSGYEGTLQKIIPLTLPQFTIFLARTREMILNGRLNNRKIKELLDKIIFESNNTANSQDWLAGFDNVISRWT